MLNKFKTRVSRTAIINLSSGSTVCSFTGCSHYSATKLFCDYLSLTLQNQYHIQTDFLTARPFLVTTTMTNNTQSMLHVSAGQCAKALVDDLGVLSVSYGSIRHRVQGYLAEMNPRVARLIFSWTMVRFRKAYLQKGNKTQ